MDRDESGAASEPPARSRRDVRKPVPDKERSSDRGRDRSRDSRSDDVRKNDSRSDDGRTKGSERGGGGN